MLTSTVIAAIRQAMGQCGVYELGEYVLLPIKVKDTNMQDIDFIEMTLK